MKLPRVLLVHNGYQYAGGEDAVVAAEAALLRRRGHVVEEFRRTHAELADMGPWALASQALWSRETQTTLADMVERFRPDIVHAHNTFPLVSPSLYWACASAHVPVVQTLHNFRLACPQGMFLRDGKPCELCLGRTPWPAVVHRCYRDSRAQSAVVSSMLTLHRAASSYRRKVTRYIALNQFCRAKFIEAGLPADRINVKPNFVDAPAPSWTGPSQRKGMLFVGRLSPEKGIDVLRDAWSHGLMPRLRVAGVGPSEGALHGFDRCSLLGALRPPQVEAEMQRAVALVMPSLWYENFPRTLVEAYAAGLPVIASRIGALAELVEEGVTGLLFEPGNAQDLVRAITWAQAHPDAMAQMGLMARARYDALYTADVNYGQLLAIYAAAMAPNHLVKFRAEPVS